VADNNASALVKLPGIGKKTAERLIIEMRDRLPEQVCGSSSTGVITKQTSPIEEAISALVALGYKPQDAEKRARAVANEDASSEQIIRSALQSAAKT